MSRRTYSLSAFAMMAMASLSFSSLDSSEAFAQAETGTVTGGASDETGPLASPEEITPHQAVFVSQAVVQPLPEPALKAEASAATPMANTLGELVAAIDTDEPLSEQMQCLAGAVYFESRGEPLAGQLAVAQVIINRSEDGRFPASYCGVVHQRSQFSFVKNGRMPQIRTSSPAWHRAKAIARIAHNGLWETEAADAIYFHAAYVRPKWSHRKTPLARIDTHVFYR